MLLRHKLVGIITLSAMLLSSHYWLPVNEVWYGHQSVLVEHMATPYAWEKRIQSWDWVESYSLTWIYPSVLRLDLVKKEPVAVTQDNRYISSKGAFFRLGSHKIKVPVLDVPDEHVPKALALIDEVGKVCSIKEYPSGSVEVVMEGKDKVLLAGYGKPKHYDEVMAKAKEKKTKVFCDFRSDQYANCH